MRSVLYLVSFWISSWSTQAQDLMSPTVDILTELGKLRTMEEKLKAMEEEIKELRREKAELQALKVRVSTMEKAAGYPIFKTVGQKYYVSNGMKAKFDHALKFCTDAGGSLALPRNEAENVALSVMHATLGSTYILLGTTDRETEGQFVDLSKKPLTFTRWMPDEPNNHHGNEDCVGIHTNAKWNDLPCDLDYHFVCELTI